MTRVRAAVEQELAAARRSQDHAAHDLDFDAYAHLTEQIQDLVAELDPLLPSPRPAP